MGGDEFLLVITHVEKAYIEATINRLREEWAGCEFDFGGKRVSITASFGIAGFCGKDAPTFQAIVSAPTKPYTRLSATAGITSGRPKLQTNCDSDSRKTFGQIHNNSDARFTRIRRD